MHTDRRFVGIDLGARALHVVTLIERGARLAVLDACVLTLDAPGALDALEALAPIASAATGIAIDAPAAPSRACHRDDPTTHVAPKFQLARCGEIALGLGAGIWVPWPTPAVAADAPAWMQVGFATWAACRQHGPEPIEVYPAGCFRVLNGGTVPPPKSRPAGLAIRRDLLAAALDPPPGFAMWSHDGLDAAVAALTAAQRARGIAVAHGHTGAGCDPGAVWLPAPPAERDHATGGR